MGEISKLNGPISTEGFPFEEDLHVLEFELGFHFEEGVSAFVSEISYRRRGLHFEVGVR